MKPSVGETLSIEKLGIQEGDGTDLENWNSGSYSVKKTFGSSCFFFLRKLNRHSGLSHQER